MSILLFNAFIIFAIVSAFYAGAVYGKADKKGMVSVSLDTIEEPVKTGVLRKVNQQVLSEETGIDIETFVGGKKNK